MLTDDADELLAADKVIFPGVGEASSAMKFLRSSGLDNAIRSISQPFLGICLGMQLLCESTEENAAECLGIVPLRVKKFRPNGLKVPQIGWNTISAFRSPLFNGVPDGSYLYFRSQLFCRDWCRDFSDDRIRRRIQLGVDTR